MRKLINVICKPSSKMDEQEKDEFLIPVNYNGTVYIETWESFGVKRKRAVCTTSTRDYLLGLGEFKDTPIKQEYFIYVCKKCGLQLSEEIMGKKCPGCEEWTYHKDCEKQCVLSESDAE